MRNAADYPLVSIVIPTCNRANLLRRALVSALEQTYPKFEIVVVDDGSADQTPQIVQEAELATDSLVYVRHDQRRGACAARNTGIETAVGEYVAFLDDDDEFTPDRIAVLMTEIQRRPDWSFVCSDYLSITRTGTRRSRKGGVISLRKILWMNYAGQSVIAEREKLRALGGWDETLTAAQDYDMWTRLIAAYGEAYRHPQVLYLYHQEHDQPRITATFSGKLRGYYGYFCKHKDRMTRRQRAYHLYRLLKLRGRRITAICFLQMVPLRFFLLEVNDYLIVHTRFYALLNRLGGVLKR